MPTDTPNTEYKNMHYGIVYSAEYRAQLRRSVIAMTDVYQAEGTPSGVPDDVISGDVIERIHNHTAKYAANLHYDMINDFVREHMESVTFLERKE